jgi:hypothetical protein
LTIRPVRPECQCRSLADLARVPIGYDCVHVTVFATLEEILAHGAELWWLYLSRCSACGRHWMLAHDDRVYDDIFLKRLDPDAAERFVATGVWPADFTHL